MFKSLHHILDVIENQPGWETQQQFHLILAQWNGVVGTTVAAHTRPTGIDRSVLWVATSSPIWAQELTFKRYLILDKLREQLNSLLRNSIEIRDIRFSPGQWQPRFDDASPISAHHPSYLPPNAQTWWQQVQSRSSHLPLCSQCQCPTPPGEIDRWNCCALCATKKWSR